MLKSLYERRPKTLSIVYPVVIVISLLVIFTNLASTGTLLPLDVELTGGKEISIFLDEQPDMALIEKAIGEGAEARIVPGVNPTLLIETSFEADENSIIQSLDEAGISGETSVRTFGPVLGEVFWRQAQMAIVLGFIAMAIIIFVIFRSFVPSVAIVLAALSDMLFVLAMLTLLNIDISLAAIAGILMIIGYSVDTDIVLTTNVTKETEGTVAERAHDAMKTGITITTTALIAVIAMYLASGSAVIQDIATVLIIGLLIDMPVTWLGNAGMLISWMKKKTGG
ncbi:MAG: hypothetical protein HYW25_02045 [Candidatus Aenigmarchaeota archaeon]|nr:hypothetical protein [Candidatus Aenigmarchaeota archaeon]